MPVIVVKTKDGSIKAFHNICRHRGNKLVWNDFPHEETSGTRRQFTCKVPRLAVQPRSSATSSPVGCSTSARSER